MADVIGLIVRLSSIDGLVHTLLNDRKLYNSIKNIKTVSAIFLSHERI